MKIDWMEETTTAIAQMDPKGWKQIYPRRYVCPHNYLDPKYWSAIACTTILAKQLQRLERRISPEECAIMDGVIKAGVPTYFLGHDFTQALLATNLPRDCSVKDLNLPLRSMLAVLPMEVSVRYFGWPVPYLAYSLADTDHGADTLMLAGGILLNKELSPIHYFARHLVSSHFNPDDLNKWPFEDYTKEMIREDTKLASFYAADLQPTAEEDKAIPTKILSLWFRIWSVLQSGEKLIEPQVQLRKERIKKGIVHRSELWSPNFIGRSYIAHRESLGGHHASPRLHWRIGHVRWQPYGPLRSQRKIIWIQPMLIGSQAKNETT